jgi:replicative DNA helicase
MAESANSVAERAATTLRVPPHSIEAEQSVIGGLLLDASSWDRVADLLNDDDFYRIENKLVFSAIRSLIDTGQPPDVVTVSEWLERQGKLDRVGGLAFLGELAQNTPSAANIVAYATIVRDHAVLRALIRTGTEITDSAFNTEGRTTPELLDLAERRVYEIADAGTRSGSGFQPVKEVLTAVMERIDKLYHLDTNITGVATGYTDLDNRTSGLQPGDLVIVAGRPSMGKTSFAMNLVEHAALASNLCCAVFSLEMPSEQLTMRLISSLGRIDQHKVRTGRLDDEDWPRLTSGLTMLNDAKIYLDDTPALTPTELRSRCRRLKREHGLDMVVIDYLQLMTVPGNGENRATEISEISRSLKALAKELSVPVVALSQLNRGLEQRINKRPMMSDLRESGAIEQDADVILFVYRDEVYDEDSPDKGIAEIIIGKQRNGPIGTVKLTFLNHITKFENYAPDGGYYG